MGVAAETKGHSGRLTGTILSSHAFRSICLFAAIQRKDAATLELKLQVAALKRELQQWPDWWCAPNNSQVHFLEPATMESWPGATVDNVLQCLSQTFDENVQVEQQVVAHAAAKLVEPECSATFIIRGPSTGSGVRFEHHIASSRSAGMQSPPRRVLRDAVPADSLPTVLGPQIAECTMIPEVASSWNDAPCEEAVPGVEGSSASTYGQSASIYPHGLQHDEPKRPPSAYFLFVRVNRSKFTGSPRTIAKCLNTEWTHLGEQRLKFDKMANDLKLEYDRQHAQWRPSFSMPANPDAAGNHCVEVEVDEEDVLEFTTLRMQTIVDMSIERFAETNGAALNLFHETSEQLKLIYMDREGALYSKCQARKLMKLTGSRCTLAMACGHEE